MTSFSIPHASWTFWDVFNLLLFFCSSLLVELEYSPQVDHCAALWRQAGVSDAFVAAYGRSDAPIAWSCDTACGVDAVVGGMRGMSSLHARCTEALLWRESVFAEALPSSRRGLLPVLSGEGLRARAVPSRWVAALC